MPVSTAGPIPPSVQTSFEIKSAQLPLVALHLRSSDWAQVSRDILAQFGKDGGSPGFFDHDALVIDFSHLDSETEVSDIVPLLKTLRHCSLIPVAVRGASPKWLGYALTLGLVQAPQEVYRSKTVADTSSATLVTQEVVKEIVREIPGPATMVIDKPLRSGQKIYARGADLVVLAMVNQGAEVVADGNIHVTRPCAVKPWQVPEEIRLPVFFHCALSPNLFRLLACIAPVKTSFHLTYTAKPPKYG